MLKQILAKYKLKKLATLNKFVFRKGVELKDIQEYTNLLNGKPQRTDFIPYDNEGNLIENHVPLFKGWTLCTDASSDVKKVAKMQTHGNSYKIYFDTAAGTTIISLEHMIDECKYNDLAIFFEGNLELN
jgi:hypothetical protein